MKLSDAILLGSTKYRAAGGAFFRDYGDRKYACALGMALGAVGKERQARTEYRLMGEEWTDEQAVIESVWPWTTGLYESCDCPVCSNCENLLYHHDYSYGSMIIHIFDHHVSYHHWTLEQLVDWVRSIEPQETPVESQPELVEAKV